jgi:hypothetical protein
MLREIWLAQPLAFARAGDSPEPLDAFVWGPNDLTPEGTGRTVLLPAESLVVSPAGDVSIAPPGETVVFKDAQDRVRPVCPFFELHGAWDGGEGPVTQAMLAAMGLSAADLRWRITFCNHKAYHWTNDAADKVEATLELAGDDTVAHNLSGVSKPSAEGRYPPLLPNGASIPLGSVQLTRPNDDLPEFRLRFTPGPGHAYGPSNLAQRVDFVVSSLQSAQGGGEYADLLKNPFVEPGFVTNAEWAGFALPPERCLLDPRAHWPNFNLYSLDLVQSRFLALLPDMGDIAARQGPQMSSELLRFIAGPDADLRNLPPGLFGWAVEPPDKLLSSLGLVDDFGDGVITCTLRTQQGQTLQACARIVTAPPVWSPDRRPVTSIADGLKDRTDRASAREAAYVRDDMAATGAEMRDLLDRAYETVGLANLDVLNHFFLGENAGHGMRPGNEYDSEQAAARLWQGRTLESAQALPLTSLAWDRHRRNTVDVFFEAFLAKTDDFMGRYVRVPAEPQVLYDRRMPGLMRGADRRPLTLTRRQYDVLAAWVAQIRAGAGAP